MADSRPEPHPAIPVAIELVRTGLTAAGTEVRVASDYPRTDPALFVRVDRAGGVMSNLITDAPLLIVECWATRGGTVRAETLAMQVRGVLANAQSKTFRGAFIRGWDEAGVAPLDDPDKPGMERWQVTGTLSIAVKHVPAETP